jgi:hypothetical protein
MKAIFTIVAKNYLPLAYTLQQSIHATDPEVPFFIFISDKKSEDDVINQDINHIYLDSLGIDQHLLYDLAFKYNVTEFCTSIKPPCFKYLNALGFDKIIYFDPDIFVYSSLDFIFRHLEDHFLVITPHYCQLETKYTGIRNEGLVLFSGVYNLGFCAVNMTYDGKSFIDWWSDRLINNSYADKWDGLHTDQKWIDIVHCLFNEPIKVLKHPGTNAAIWNMHERVAHRQNGQWHIHFTDSVNIAPLIFFHFSSFVYYAEDMPNKLFPPYPERFPFLVELCQEYRNVLLINGLNDYRRYSYSFDTYLNGDPISSLHRRFYRRLAELHQIPVKNPFEVGPGTFHQLLKTNNLLFEAKSKKLESQNELNLPGFDSKVRKINLVMTIIKNIIGIEKYFLLIKFFQRYFRFENQYFLIKELRNGYLFLNEGRTSLNDGRTPK